MKKVLKIFNYDMEKIFTEKKTLSVILFMSLLTSVICIAYCIFMQSDTESPVKTLGIIHGIVDRNEFISFFVTIFSFMIYTTFPAIIGIFIISYLKEFGELELMMLFPINRKLFFLEKIFCTFFASLLPSWINIVFNTILQSILMKVTLSFSIYKIFYSLIVLPLWLFFISLVTVIISALSKDSKEANQRSIIWLFALFLPMQFVFCMRFDIYSYKIIFIPLIIGIIGSFLLLFVINRYFNVEKILYYRKK